MDSGMVKHLGYHFKIRTENVAVNGSGEIKGLKRVLKTVKIKGDKLPVFLNPSAQVLSLKSR